jgi:arginyl-tRNA synthetase
VTLRELREEVGNDAARFFYVMRRYDNHIDFDLDLAKSQSNENPVYYLQYAHARICSVFRQAEERGLPLESAVGLKSLNLLVEDEEKQLMHLLSRYPEVIVQAALDYEPHQLTNYLREVATLFHAYYNAHHFMVDDAPLRQARLTLLLATRQILQNGFELLGINAPDVM